MENLIINSLALIGLFASGYIVIKYLSKTESEKKLDNEKEVELIENSYDCLLYANGYSLTTSEILNGYNHNEKRKKLFEMIKEPEIRAKALKAIQDKLERKRKEKQDFIDKRKVGYKYENEIFEIFDTYYKLTQNEIVNGLMEKFSINHKKASVMFQECLDYWLIQEVNTRVPVDKVYYRVGFILEHDEFKITPSDLTRKDWLVKNKKNLEHRVNIENDLPF